MYLRLYVTGVYSLLHTKTLVMQLVKITSSCACRARCHEGQNSSPKVQHCAIDSREIEAEVLTGTEREPIRTRLMYRGLLVWRREQAHPAPGTMASTRSETYDEPEQESQRDSPLPTHLNQLFFRHVLHIIQGQIQVHRSRSSPTSFCPTGRPCFLFPLSSKYERTYLSNYRLPV